MYKRILVPVDGSDTSQAGLEHAILLAKDQGAALKMLHVVHDYLVANGRHGLASSDQLLRELKEQGKTVLAEAVTLAQRREVAAESILIESPLGPVGEAIADYAVQWPADLIVIGTHGRRGVRRLVMGSDAEFVVRTTTVPTLLIRGPRGK